MAADGCLGGSGELDRAVLDAQKAAPLTEAGAAAFTATLMRWTYVGPPPPFQQVTAKQVLTKDASSYAHRTLSSSHDLKGTTGGFDFTDGRYYVEAFDGTSAIVSWSATGHATEATGTVPEDGLVGGSVHLKAVNGTWHYADQTLERPLLDIERIGTKYAAGC
ncbi:MAG: hypothetical protein ABI661_04615 [Gammaproteobacteria bacterium]